MLQPTIVCFSSREDTNSTDRFDAFQTIRRASHVRKCMLLILLCGPFCFAGASLASTAVWLTRPSAGTLDAHPIGTVPMNSEQTLCLKVRGASQLCRAVRTLQGLAHEVTTGKSLFLAKCSRRRGRLMHSLKPCGRCAGMQAPVPH